MKATNTDIKNLADVRDKKNLLRTEKKRSSPGSKRESSSRRGIRRHRFTSPFDSFSEESDTEDESEVSNYTPVKRQRPLKPHLASIQSAGFGSSSDELDGQLRQPLSIQTAVRCHYYNLLFAKAYRVRNGANSQVDPSFSLASMP